MVESATPIGEKLILCDTLDTCKGAVPVNTLHRAKQESGSTVSRQMLGEKGRVAYLCNSVPIPAAKRRPVPNVVSADTQDSVRLYEDSNRDI